MIASEYHEQALAPHSIRTPFTSSVLRALQLLGLPIS